MANVKVSPPPGFGDKFILVHIYETGSKIEAFGFSGQSCKSATKPFEEVLGGKVTDKKDKPPETTVRIGG